MFISVFRLAIWERPSPVLDGSEPAAVEGILDGADGVGVVVGPEVLPFCFEEAFAD